MAGGTVHAARLQVKPEVSFCESTTGAECIADAKFSPREAGKLNGVSYRFYDDGSGAVMGREGGDIDNLYNDDWKWKLTCSRDPVGGHKQCTAVFGNTWLIVRSKGPDQVSVGTDHYPGTPTAMKVGTRRFDTIHRDGDFAQSRQILPLLQDGTLVATRYMKWPYRSWVDEEYPIYGAQAAIQLMRWLIRNSN